MHVAVDAMGGDHAPAAVVEGAVLASRKFSGLKITLVGQPDAIEAELARLSVSGLDMAIHPASEVVAMDEPSKVALREKRGSSITQTIQLLKDGAADAGISAGHTGAAVAASTIMLGRLSGVRRPGLAVTFPSLGGRSCLVVDVGANVGCEPLDLLHYGQMASIFLQQVRGVTSPRIGLMSVGSEQTKGNKLVKETQQFFEDSGLNYGGNAEGGDIFSGDFDVVVCDGFVGNVTLKALESLARNLTSEVRLQLFRSWRTKLGALLCAPAFREIKAKLDTAEYGGAPLLGVDGHVIITHGASCPRAVCNSIKCAADWAEHSVNEHIVADIVQPVADEAGVEND